jgi:hypothetical protein
MKASRPKFVRSCLVLGIVMILALSMIATTSFAQIAVGYLILNDSPRGVGLGGCSINLVTPESPLYNPAGLGLFHLDHVLSVSLPNSTKFYPELVSDLRLQSWGASGGMSFRQLRLNETSRFNVALGLAYSRFKIDFGKFAITDPYGTVIDTYDSYDKTDYFSGGLGLEFRPLRIGFGYTYKRIKSVLGYGGTGIGRSSGTATSNAHDYGYLAQIRLHELAPHKWYFDQAQKYYAHLELTPSYAYVKANVGDSMAYLEAAEKDPLPEVTHRGPAVYGAIDINQARLISVYWTSEIWKASYAETEAKPHGLELGVGDIFFYRTGKFVQPMVDPVDSKGYGFSLSGVVVWLDVLGQADTNHSVVGRWARRLDVRFDYAKLSGANSVFDNTKYYKITVSLAR